ncbi:DUF4276 family protein [Melittangium boletus]|uniref:DUF4276 family protein n=1 Tax=Melittangium boletus DSM 14713 TaxID=1294270 RepID=A0A250IP29_9BACT|nr:DUF4276 family protein [Melittangium boletus]ATB32927.1 hypothetical protein MEBOL_006416 [Melittangium boletus DSM 14713]
MKVGLIVEGHGEVRSLPILLRRILRELDPQHHCSILNAHRVSRGLLVKEEGLRPAVELMARKVGPEGRILLLLDADDDLPCQLGPSLLAQARGYRPDRDISVVIATREYEAWFLTAAESLRGRRGLPLDLAPPLHPEGIRDAKKWLGQRKADGYSETVDQPALTGLFDLTAARRSDSFDKLFREVGRLFGLPVPPR